MANRNRPLYSLQVVDKDNKKRVTYAGVAFQNDFDGLSLILSPGVRLDWTDNVYLNLVPYAQRYQRRNAVADLPEDEDDGPNPTGNPTQDPTDPDRDFPF